jgi:DNA-binding NarL/FixJ family response regulator
MSPDRDPIALVEACYDLAASDEAWLRTVAERAQPLLRVTDVLAYHVDVDDRGISFRTPVSAQGDADVVRRIRYMGDMLERRRSSTLGLVEGLQAKVYEKVVRAALAEPADSMLLSEMNTFGPRWMYTLGVPGVNELLHLLNHHIDGQGLTALVGPRPKRNPLRAPERATLQMLGAHIKAGLRLRRRLREQLQAVAPTPNGAVLDASSHLVHAAGDAQREDVRELLERKAREIDRARTRERRGHDDALEIWQGLIDGRWSLVERFDADGKRFLLAHENPEQVIDPRGLGELESRIVGLAVRGFSDKLIAYHLGIAEGTASAHLTRALRKLGMSNRVELVRTLGPYYPQPGPTDPRRDDLRADDPHT